MGKGASRLGKSAKIGASRAAKKVGNIINQKKINYYTKKKNNADNIIQKITNKHNLKGFKALENIIKMNDVNIEDTTPEQIQTLNKSLKTISNKSFKKDMGKLKTAKTNKVNACKNLDKLGAPCEYKKKFRKGVKKAIAANKNKKKKEFLQLKF